MRQLSDILTRKGADPSEQVSRQGSTTSSCVFPRQLTRNGDAVFPGILRLTRHVCAGHLSQSTQGLTTQVQIV